MYYNRARYYDPQIGRFISSDPSGFFGGLNSYAYVGDNPISLIDPTGLDWIEYAGQRPTVWPGKFKDRGHPPLLQCKATSGFPSYRNSALDNQELGPVPHGHYRINLSLDPKRWASMVPSGENLAAAYGVQRIRPSYRAANGQILLPEGWGTWRARLEPRNVSTTRSNFYVHNSKKGFTHGCIETSDSLYSRFVTYHDQGGIDVLVNYTTSSTFEGTNVP
ncbi:MAG TPA: RHS repeat-associated core domain-containing protein [Blastocatellia bacterium]|nr:RHS repeat-associated core domain-containing protein [Blastocatellia bacterium]